jgi:hypothetical protein
MPINTTRNTHPAELTPRRRRRRLLRLLTAGLIPMALVLVLGASGTAHAATITKSSSFSCNYNDQRAETRSLTVYFPELRTSGGNETVYFSPDLYRYTSSGWQLANGTKPWYRTTVGPNGIYTINGYKWFINQTPYRNVPFSNLTPGYYAIKGYFYGGTSQWSNVGGGSSTYCYVS